MATIQHDVGIVECRARRIAVACRYAGQANLEEAPAERWQAQQLAYRTSNSVLPGQWMPA